MGAGVQKHFSNGFKTCLMYHDYLLNLSRKFEDHMMQVDKVLTILNNAGVSLKIYNSKFLRKRLYYLAKVLLYGRIATANDSTFAVSNANLQDDITQLCSVLLVCILYHRFTNYFRNMDEVLNRWLRKDVSPTWHNKPDEHQDAFLALNKSLVEPSFFALFVENRPFLIYMESFAYRIGVTHIQHQNDENRTKWVIVGY